ncbi:conserved alanine and leucine rich membrane protein [Mycobacteroides abscessus subsp. massiliense]|uniref:DUF3159 domain-containing protein n=1 Tax=Mycobacteroides abscessus TaxID=36809 RepID=UPI0009A78E38|nr:DUF3159 domain-containing protein [Mycobacteroides abscessus]SKH58774.1 conserved alanine and leucine rich membrane protein [Mycobacteroides abscessus subsp. massiliense]SKH92822.1 conserved alanine and leucine rich membrane protein [Mycobacteroides abscessus subsp. massiliense]SKI13235.1 conserved alanine and leucine rich membrane protein [Mycobacteroides abscessus subsp. massiliense]SKJ98941.1 conserved alanine and leucine rich membrane protein [Mycobacteroides abscessus subsp. massiliense
MENEDGRSDLPGLADVNAWKIAGHLLGGRQGLIAVAAPTAVFTVVSSVTELPFAAAVSAMSGLATVCGAVAFGLSSRLALTGLGLFSVSLATAVLTNTAANYYAIGLWVSLGSLIAGVVSIASRRPLLGYWWAWALGRDIRWQHSDTAVRAFSQATAITVAPELARFAVQFTLYHSDHTLWLAAAYLIMGWPVALATFTTTYPFIRKAHRATVEELQWIVATTFNLGKH